MQVQNAADTECKVQAKSNSRQYLIVPNDSRIVFGISRHCLAGFHVSSIVVQGDIIQFCICSASCCPLGMQKKVPYNSIFGSPWHMV